MPEPIVTLNEESLRSDLRELVRRAVEDTPNGLLEEEVDGLAGAERYERTAGREAHRAGHYDRGLATSSGEVTIRMPKPRGMRLTTAIIERYRRREGGVGEAMMETCLAGVSTRRIEDVSEILWGSSVSAATVSNLNEKAFASVEGWRNRPLERACPYVYVDGICLKRSWGGSYENVAVMVATGVNDDGCREVIGAAEGLAESSGCWRGFLSRMKSRGLRGAGMLAGDRASGMVGSMAGSSRKPPTSAAPLISTATCWRGYPGRGGPGSPPCSRPSTRWSRARRPRQRRREWSAGSRGRGSGRPRRPSGAASPRR